jgi:hypothetical protein
MRGSKRSARNYAERQLEVALNKVFRKTKKLKLIF